MDKIEICRVMPYDGGHTVQIFGENISADSKLYWWRKGGNNKTVEECGVPFAKPLPETPPEDAKVYDLNNVVNNQVAYVYGDRERGVPSGAAIIWLENETGFSKPFRVNVPVILNQSFWEAYPGQVISVFGDMLNAEQRATPGYAYFKNITTGEVFTAPIIHAKDPVYQMALSRHRANYIVPENATEGEYEVYVHPNCGAEYSWSEPIKLTVKKEYSVTDYFRTRFNRRMDEHIPMPKCEVRVVPANPLGSLYDITDELQGALDEVYNLGGGIVNLTAGVYGIRKTLDVKEGVILRGAGEGATTVCVAEDCDFKQDWSTVSWAARANNVKAWARDWRDLWLKYDQASLLRLYNNCGVEGIRFEMGNKATFGIVIANDNEEATCYGVFVNNVTVDGSGIYRYDHRDYGDMVCGIVTTCSNTELTIYKSTFRARCPMYIMPAYNFGAKIINNVVDCAPKNYDESFVNGLVHSMVVENVFSNGRRAFCNVATFDNNWIYQNRVEGTMRGWNANEAYMSENGTSEWGGYAEEIGEDYIVIPADSPELDPDFCPKEVYPTYQGALTTVYMKEVPHVVCILSGRGFGQWRRIKAIEKNKIVLDGKWDIMPDSTTAFTIASGTFQNMWIDNNCSLSNSHSQFIWNCGIENIVNNHIMDLAGGIRAYSLSYYTGNVNATGVVAYNQFIHCEARGSGKALWLNSDGWRIDFKPDYIKNTGGGIFGNSIRKCKFDGMGSTHYMKNLAVIYTTAQPPHAGMAIGGAFNTICNNMLGGYKMGIRFLDPECLGNCLDINYYKGVDVPVSGHPKKLIGNDIMQGRVFIGQ